MRPGDKLPNDQAEVTFTEQSIDWLIENVNVSQREAVFDAIVGLFKAPHGKHRLSNQAVTRLVGFNTVEAGEQQYRIVYRASSQDSVGLIEIITVGLRRDGKVYNVAHDLVHSGKLTDDDQTQIWDALTLLDETKVRLGLEDWDYFDKPAPEGLVKAAVAAGLLDEETAKLLTQEELILAMEAGWAGGIPDPTAALHAALQRVESSIDPERILGARTEDRCGANMVRAEARCVRAKGHPGAHRSRR